MTSEQYKARLSSMSPEEAQAASKLYREDYTSWLKIYGVTDTDVAGIDSIHSSVAEDFRQRQTAAKKAQGSPGRAQTALSTYNPLASVINQNASSVSLLGR